MKIIDLPSGPEFIRGAVRGLDRMPEKLHAVYSSPKHRIRAACASGVRAIFEMDAPELTFSAIFGESARPFHLFDVEVDGHIFAFDGPGPHRLCLSGAKQRVTVYLPHLVQVRGMSIAVPVSASFSAVPEMRKKILFCGDSIIQGMMCVSPARTIVAWTATALDMDFHNTAVGGATMCREQIESALSIGGDVIVAAFGINDAIMKTPFDSFRQETGRVFSLLEACGIPAVFASPIPNLNNSTPELEAYREIIVSVSRSHPGVRLLDGYRFFPPDPRLYADGIHPGESGMNVYSNILTTQIKEILS